VNILYLLKILNTNKISELVANIDAPFLDINLAIWDAVKNGDVEVNEEKDKITPLKNHEVSFDSDLANKLLRVVQHYNARETNITRGRLNSLVKNTATEFNHKWHDYIMALQYLIDSGQVEEQVITVPKTNKRPYHKFVFLCIADNPNEEWNSREVNKWIANWEKKAVK
jgi:hypothetical protein